MQVEVKVSEMNSAAHLLKVSTSEEFEMQCCYSNIDNPNCAECTVPYFL